MQKTQTLILLISLIVCSFFLNSISSKKLKAKTQKVQDVKDDNLKAILKDDYQTFVKKLGENIKDPKFRAAIRSLSAKNKVNFADIAAPVSTLIPTQNEIDVDKSLKFPLTTTASASAYLNCEKPITIAGKGIVTADGGHYVIDGHHRWSQVYSINPLCEMAALDLADIKDPINALKGTQLGIASGKDKDGSEINAIPIALVQGKNLLTISEVDLKAYVVKTLTNPVLDVFKAWDEELDTKVKVADYIWGNVSDMRMENQPVAGAPGRGFMPQTDLVVNWTENAVNADKVQA
jgi:hypothetical protein